LRIILICYNRFFDSSLRFRKIAGARVRTVKQMFQSTKIRNSPPYNQNAMESKPGARIFDFPLFFALSGTKAEGRTVVYRAQGRPAPQCAGGFFPEKCQK